jgi:hypothetical protein
MINIDQNFIFVAVIILFIILVSIQYTLNKILSVLKEIKSMLIANRNKEQ